MELCYVYLGKQERITLSPGGIALLRYFTTKAYPASELSEMAVGPEYAQTRTAARTLDKQGILRCAEGTVDVRYRLSPRGLALVTCCREHINGEGKESEHHVVFTYKGVEPNLLITAEAAEVLGHFKPYAPGIETYEPGVKPSPGLRATYAQMVEEGIMINCSIEHENTMFTLTGLGRLVRKAMQEEKAKPAPDAWRYRYAADERDVRAWSFTDDHNLISRLGEEFEVQPLVVQQ